MSKGYLEIPDCFKTYFWALGMSEQVDELLKELHG